MDTTAIAGTSGFYFQRLTTVNLHDTLTRYQTRNTIPISDTSLIFGFNLQLVTNSSCIIPPACISSSFCSRSRIELSCSRRSATTLSWRSAPRERTVPSASSARQPSAPRWLHFSLAALRAPHFLTVVGRRGPLAGDKAVGPPAPQALGPRAEHLRGLAAQDSNRGVSGLGPVLDVAAGRPERFRARLRRSKACGMHAACTSHLGHSPSPLMA